jgi:hypothetical protein
VLVNRGPLSSIQSAQGRMSARPGPMFSKVMPPRAVISVVEPKSDPWWRRRRHVRPRHRGQSGRRSRRQGGCCGDKQPVPASGCVRCRRPCAAANSC